MEFRNVLLALCFALSACGFKENSDSAQAVPQAPTMGALEIIYGGAPALVQKRVPLMKLGSGALYRAAEAIVLPTAIPDRVSVSITLPKPDEAQTESVARAYGVIGSDVTRLIGLTAQASPQARGGLELSGLRSLLSDQEEQKATVTVEFAGAGGTLQVVEFPVLSPPSRMEWQQLSVAEYEGRGRSIPRQIFALKSAALRLDLLQVLSIKNPTDGPRRVGIPLQLSGSLSTHVDTVSVTQQWCAYRLNSQGRDDRLGSSFYFLPLSSDLNRTFLNVINNAIGENQISLEIPPGESVAVGVYGQGERVADLADHGHARSDLQPMTVVASCKTRCGSADGRDMAVWHEDNRSYPQSNSQAHVYWQTLGMPGASRQCVAAHCRPFFPQHPYTPDLCTACAEFEINQSGLPPWDGRRFCQSAAPGNPWGYPARELWVVEKAMGTVQAGARTNPIYLEFDPQAVTASIGYVDPKPASTDELRRVAGFLKAKVMQAE